MKLTRIIVYEGPDSTTKRILHDSLKDGVHYMSDVNGTCTVTVVTADAVPTLAGIQLPDMVRRLVQEHVIPDTAMDIERAKKTQYLSSL